MPRTIASGQRRAEDLRVVLGERELVRRAAEMRVEDVRVGVIYERRLVRPSEKRVGVGHEVLVERVVAGDQDRERSAARPSGAAGLLERARDGAGVAGEDARVEPADVDPELERRGRRDPEQIAVDERPLELPPFLGEVAGAVRGHAIRQVRPLALEPLARIRGDQLRALARLGERDRAHALPDEPREQPGGLGVGAAPRAGGLVDHRRVPQREQLLASRGSVGREPRRTGCPSGARRAPPGSRSSPTRRRTAATRRTGRPGAATGAGRSPRGTRRCRGACASRRSPRSTRCFKNVAHRSWVGRIP